ncbi:MAG: pentapeptide repeat-containing protein [Polyangiaceae bacterium]|nr:pentapeptide repeat-containing protein [Polyangiaceae bacterium]
MSDSTLLGPPESFFEQPIHVTANWKALLYSLGKSFSKALYGKYVSGDSAKVDAAVADALGAFGLQFKSTPAEIAWNLCRRALGAAIVELLRTMSIPVQPEDAPDTQFTDAFVQQIDWTMIRLDATFFEHPEQVPFLRPVQVILEEWLAHRGMSRPEARNVAHRLRSHFASALHDEWRSRLAEYKPLEQHIQGSPFMKASERERAWLRHAAALKKACEASMFGESFGLAQVFVPLRAYHEERLDEERDRRAPGHGQRIRRTVVQVDEKLDAWVHAADKNDALRVLSGGPGSGKSSCAKMFAARMAEQGHHVLLIPLHLVNPDDGIPIMVRRFVDDGDHLPFDPLETQGESDRLLVIFDGLDELSMQGKSGSDGAKAFLEEVRRFLDRHNHARLRVQVLVGGREIVVQQARHVLREAKQILILMPYLSLPHMREQEKNQGIEYEASSADLDEDQRVDWWNRYTTVKGQSPPGMPEELQRPELAEITAQPLLNYLVALSRQRKTIDFTQKGLRNRIYADLLDGVYKRAHRERKPHASDLEYEDFVELLEEIGLAVWHGNGRTATVKEIRGVCGERIDKLLRRYEDGEARVMGLLTAFYFRKHHDRRDDEATFEFTHKSFGEYLTARRIVRELRDMHDDRQRATKRRPWDIKDALRDWANVCGPTAMDGHLLPFVIDEVALEDAELVGQWQKLLQELIGHVLRYGMPMERLVPRPDYLEEMHQARNAEEALLACLYACAERTEIVSHIEWLDQNSAGSWLHRLRGQVSGKGRIIAMQCLGRLDLSECWLSRLDLWGASLCGANLQHAILWGTSLSRADLRGANLKGALLKGVILQGANLQGADLKGANLQGANLQGADLQGANLEGANLFRADLRGADLQGAKLQGANLQGANVQGANLLEANLRGANLDGANLTDALMDP